VEVHDVSFVLLFLRNDALNPLMAQIGCRLPALQRPRVASRAGAEDSGRAQRAGFRTQFEAFDAAQLELPADEGAVRIDGAAHAGAIEQGAPAILEPAQDAIALLVHLDQPFGDCRFAEKRDLLAAAAGVAV
tara:strand:- start:6045 stop:6440 length:396 start_codon:yes stop_codon:yes gene_type:complete